jgi:hypothetical protein
MKVLSVYFQLLIIIIACSGYYIRLMKHLLKGTTDVLNGSLFVKWQECQHKMPCILVN